MGLGYAISEDLPMEGGRPKSTMLRKCGILRAKDMPEMEVIGVEVPDPYGPYGAKGVGEIGLGADRRRSRQRALPVRWRPPSQTADAPAAQASGARPHEWKEWLGQREREKR